MSIKASSQVEGTDSEDFELVDADDTHINVRNCAKKSIYTVELTTDGTCALSCTCPDYKYRQSKVIGGRCKHMRAVEENTDEFDTTDDGRVTGPYDGSDCYGNVDHQYWKCQRCGAEATDKRALGGVLGDCC